MRYSNWGEIKILFSGLTLSAMANAVKIGMQQSYLTLASDRELRIRRKGENSI